MWKTAEQLRSYVQPRSYDRELDLFTLFPPSREAMAAFFYRAAGSPQFEAPAVSPFKDVASTSPFYKEIAWMSSAKLSTGWADGNYRPYDEVSREVTAAFFYRADQNGMKF